MSALTIVQIPTPSLREPSRLLTVDEIEKPEFQAFLDQLVETMYLSNGIGIAAPQVGKNVRVIAVHTPKGAQCYLNPAIVKASDATKESEEGCLSVPGKAGLVVRHKKVTVQALTREGRKIEFDAKNLQSFVFQHEIDHLDGILFIDKAIKVVETKKSPKI